MAMTTNTFQALGPHGFHRIHYTEWGEPSNERVAICVHGLTRNARDFDALAEALQNDYRVLCPDVVGRGRSDWLINKNDYGYPLYMSDMAALIARSGARQVDWIGTSMGGLIGMFLAAQPNTPIGKLVVNDVGPFIPKAALERIAEYVGKTPRFVGLADMEGYIREIAASFGRLSDEQWRHLTVHSARQLESGEYVLRYDPGIAEPFQKPQNDMDLWSVWDAIRCPVLALRGVESDLLLRTDAEAMTRRGPRAKLVEFAEAGHAPALMEPAQIAIIRDWLLDN